MIPQAFLTAAVAILTILSNGASALEDTKQQVFYRHLEAGGRLD